MDDHAKLAARWLADAPSVVVLTGAGISAESGIPTFRGEGGLWRRHRAEDLATPDAFARDPELVWEWYRYRQGICAGAAPNAAHAALARVEERAPSFTLITQNVDGLHRRAGSRNVISLHGDVFRARCTVCDAGRDLTGDEASTIPECPARHPMRPDIVWFGEMLPQKAMADAAHAAAAAKLFLVIGTSAIVYPAAAFPLIAKDAGAKLVEVNREATPLTELADISFRGKAAEVLPGIVERAFPRSGKAG